MAGQATNNICQKKGFKTKKIAQEALEEILKYPTKVQKRELKHVYKCDQCGFWHLTSMSKKQFQIIDRNKKDREALSNVPKDIIEKRIEYLKQSYKIKNKFKQ